MHHRDGGPDPTELELTAQQVIHRPTGACHTSHNHPSQPVMGVGKQVLPFDCLSFWTVASCSGEAF